jgi:L-fuculose-phosphate aldolase
MEYYANILMITGKILGKQNCFTKEQVDRLIAMREKFGISRGGVPRTEKED